MLARRRQAVVVQAGHEHFHGKLPGIAAVLGRVIGIFDKRHVRCQHQAALGPFQAGKVGYAVQRQVQLGNITIGAQAIDPVGELYVQVPGAQQLEKTGFRVGIGHDLPGPDDLAAFEFDADCLALFHGNPRHRAGQSHLGTVTAGPRRPARP